MVEYLKKFALTHISWLVILSVVLVASHSWLGEHDARLLAESQTKDLQTQIADIRDEAAHKVQTITKVVHDVHTVPQAIIAIPQLTEVPLNPQPAPNADQIAVDALPLIQVLGQAKVDAVNLKACEDESKKKDDIIAAASKKPAFWHRVTGTLKAVGIGIGIGVAIGAHGL